LVTSIKRSRAGLGTPGRPVGCFLFTGPTGVGKTEVSRQISAILGVEFIRFDMSEYMEKHTVARLIGAPPGYIGFDQGGLLTDGIRKHPHSVLLMDEIEKAHPDLFNILLQVMDHATLTDNNGKKADFRNVILMMTSNAGSREMSQQSIGFGDVRKDAASKGIKAIEKMFSPEFRNRLDEIITFNSLNLEIMEKVVDKFMAELNGQLAVKKIKLTISPLVRTWLAEKGHDPTYGARPLARVIQTEIKDALSDQILFGRLHKGGEVSIDLKEDNLVFSYG
ncbi:MAG: AAA family ATPase, partial [Desulfobacterales bacterium]